jgi:hypothetical protein
VNTFKQLPWGSLCLSSLLAVVVVRGIDFFLMRGLPHLDKTSALGQLLVTPAGYMLLLLCGGLAMGGLGVAFLERMERISPIYVSTLWGLVLCLFISLWLVNLLPMGGLGLSMLTQLHLPVIVVGVFWRGKPYWR